MIEDRDSKENIPFLLIDPAYTFAWWGKKLQREQTKMIKENKLNLIEEQNEQSVDQRPQLRVITGGKGSDDENWLAALELNTIFLARPKGSKDLILSNFMLSRRTPSGESTNLRQVTPDDRVMDLWVPTLEFSRQWVLHEVVAVVGLEYNKEQEENSDGSDGAIQPGRLPDDAGSETGLTVDEDTSGARSV